MMPIRSVLAGVFLLALAAPLPAQDLSGLDAYITRAMEQWGVPGLGVALVKDDEVIFAKGFGVRSAETGEPVDEHTLFAVGSTSKAFTAAAVATLVDEGRLSWDDRVADVLPGFRMYDPYATNELTVRDLMSHQSGLARGDAVWTLWQYDRDEVVRRIRYLEPTESFRSAWQYQNLMWLTAGEVVEEVTGRTWDAIVEERLFQPLGMRRSDTTWDSLPTLTNYAAPHQTVNGELRVIRPKDIDNVGPAGSIVSSAWEMAQWLRMQLNDGVYEGRRVLSDSVVREMHEPQFLVQRTSGELGLFPNRLEDRMFRAYGLGWFVYDFRGEKMVEHSGGIDGFRAHVGMIPSRDLGVVVLSNERSNNLVVALMWDLMDRLLGEPNADWWKLKLEQDLEGRRRAEEARRQAAESRLQGTRPSLPLDAYAGVYENEYLGEIRVERAGDGLVLWVGQKAAELDHWHIDTFEGPWRYAPDGRITVSFEVGPRGAVAALEVASLGEEFRKVR